jgi:hypothetical protein
MVLGFSQSGTEGFSGREAGPAPKADNLTAICEPIV